MEWTAVRLPNALFYFLTGRMKLSLWRAVLCLRSRNNYFYFLFIFILIHIQICKKSKQKYKNKKYIVLWGKHPALQTSKKYRQWSFRENFHLIPKDACFFTLMGMTFCVCGKFLEKLLMKIEISSPISSGNTRILKMS